MRRRALLGALSAGAAAGLAGCNEIGDESVTLDATELENCLSRELDDSTYGPDQETNQGVSVGVENDGDREWSVRVQVAGNGETIVDETVTVGEGEFTGVIRESIRTTGEYTLAVAVDGGESVETTWRVCVDSFILVVVVESGGEIGFSKPGEEFESE